MLTDYQNSLMVRLGNKFVMKPSLKIPAYLQHVATPPREMFSVFLNHSCQ